MLQIQSFTFSPFQENTYLLYNENKRGIIIDPGCFEIHEKSALQEYIAKNGIVLERLLLTHGHIDHILGNKFIFDTYGLLPEMHEADLPFIELQMASAQRFGLNTEQSPLPKQFIEENTTISFYDDTLEVIYTPGHSKGSISFYCKQQNFIINGDVLFYRSIGRTDLPGGKYEELIKTIKEKLFQLPAETIVYSGHGPATKIGEEISENPFLNNQ
jgi:hydroxyacylglutathione hydrolase